MSDVQLPQGARSVASERVALAQLALESALSVDGVLSSSVGTSGLWITAAKGLRIPGVVAAAQPDGRYGLSLHLVVQPVPLHALAEQVRNRVVRNAELAGLDGALGPVDVSIEDVVAGPEDVV